MRIKRDSRLARWAYLFSSRRTIWSDGSRNKVPPSTTLCILFWRAFLITPVYAIVTFLLTGFLFYVVIHGVIQIGHHLRLFLITVSSVAVAFAVGFGLSYLSKRHTFGQSVFHSRSEGGQGEVLPDHPFRLTSNLRSSP